MPEEVRFKIEKLLPWGFAGALLTLLIGVGTVYITLREKAPSITYETSEYNVLDVHRPLKDLSVLFRGQDIQSKKLNLRIYSISVRNDGELNIRQTDFDQSKPWGLSIAGAQIIDQPRLVYASSDYIKENLNPRTTSDSQVEFNKIIFEKGKTFTIEIQVLHQTSIEPVIEPTGKIAGIESIQVVQRKATQAKPSIWTESFQGSAGVQAMRIIAYFLVLIVVFVLVISIAVRISDAADKKRQKALNSRTKEYLQPLLIARGERGQQLIYQIFENFRGNADTIKAFVDTLLDMQRIQNGQVPGKAIWRLARDHQRMLSLRLTMNDLLFEDANDDPQLNPKAVAAVEDLVKFLNENPLPAPLEKLAKRQTIDELTRLQVESQLLQEKTDRLVSESSDK
jgi:hypothetical protein